MAPIGLQFEKANGGHRRLHGAVKSASDGTIEENKNAQRSRATSWGRSWQRFFLGVLGATFVPCQVWCTGFFDKNVVGTANALAGGWGNAGGGITYFIMPAVFDSLVARQGLSPSTAWRVTFVVPLVCLVACALGMMLLCPDSPVGDWSARGERIQENLRVLQLRAGSTDTGIMTPSDTYSSSEEEKGSAKLPAPAGGISHQQAMDIAC